MAGLLSQIVLLGLVISLVLLGLGLTMEGLAGPYALWGIGTGIAFVGVLGTGGFGGVYIRMLTGGSKS